MEVRTEARSRIEHERERRGSVGVAFDAWERDRLLGGPLLAGGVAYRVFLWQLPAAVLTVGVLGVAADAGAEAPAEVVRRAGLSAAVADVVAQAVREAGEARWWLVLVGLVLTMWAGRSGARAVMVTSAIAWGLPPARVAAGPVASLWFTGTLAAAIAIQSFERGPLGDVLGGIVASWVVVSGMLLALVSVAIGRLPHRASSWTDLLPGALLMTVAFRGLSLGTGVYFAGRIDRVDDLYGGLGIAIVILLYLYLAARSFVWGQFLNARIAGVGSTSDPAPEDRVPPLTGRAAGSRR